MLLQKPYVIREVPRQSGYLKGTWSIIEERKKLKKILLDAKSPWLKESSRFVRRERLRSYKKSAGEIDATT